MIVTNGRIQFCWSTLLLRSPKHSLLKKGIHFFVFLCRPVRLEIRADVFMCIRHIRPTQILLLHSTSYVIECFIKQTQLMEDITYIFEMFFLCNKLVFNFSLFLWLPIDSFFTKQTISYWFVSIENYFVNIPNFSLFKAFVLYVI